MDKVVHPAKLFNCLRVYVGICKLFGLYIVVVLNVFINLLVIPIRLIDSPLSCWGSSSGCVLHKVISFPVSTRNINPYSITFLIFNVI